YAYSGHPNIVTSMEFERILSASGPSAGHLARPSDNRVPRKIAWIQCIGSRDIHHCDNGYCSSVCCMYAIKEAVIAKEHEGRDLDCAIFYMDIRTHGKDFERYYNDAKEKHGVRFIKSRIPAIEPDSDGDDLVIRYVDEKENVAQETFEMVVLSVGLESTPDALDLAGSLDLSLTEGGFYRTDTFRPVSSSRNGIYACGTCQGPKDIPQCIIEAGAAAAEAGAILGKARDTLTRAESLVQERNILGEGPRVGVFLCHCGINISGVVNIGELKEYAASLPHVEYVTDNLYTCSQDTQEIMARIISEEELNRIVVAACTPKTHEPLFQDTLASAGLNKYLLEMTNIRNQDSWVHKDNPGEATEKAKDLVRMAVAKVALMEPLEETVIDINQTALVIGGGLAGMVAARNLSGQGYQVVLVERRSELGGNALGLFRTWRGEDIQEKVRSLIQSVETDPKIEVCKEREVVSVEGFVGNFRTTLGTVGGKGETRKIDHGVAIIATGAEELKPGEYLYGKDPRVVTHLELDRMFKEDGARIKHMEAVVFIQCVGSREPERPYCSRVCCTHAIECALHIKDLNPDAEVYVLYRDIRTYGEREYIYREARLKGVLFIPFSRGEKPEVISTGGGLEVRVLDPFLRKTIVIEADLVALASGIISRDQEDLARFFKVPLNEDGFFVEAHAKLGPSEFATEGVFLCGMAHYPKSIDESIAQALAASSRASTLLARKFLRVSGTIATVEQAQCSHCGVCVSICPYSAPRMVEEGRDRAFIEINPVLCKGCGLCVSSCRSGAINLMGFSEEQIMAMINES
ncbi:MAG: CoB--CoM heterodisulfide reductase iron-sulfur subunit A family protein, partial [Deltaproteobacteria bacterium]|nr:CoB--CoM heterodisulfide reductase iron-sulfur subunit A family protein [Deltaproteobacteria bacterium]